MLELIFDTESSADEGIESRFSDTYDVCVKAVGDATSLQNSVTVTFAIEESRPYERFILYYTRAYVYISFMQTLKILISHCL